MNINIKECFSIENTADTPENHNLFFDYKKRKNNKKQKKSFEYIFNPKNSYVKLIFKNSIYIFHYFRVEYHDDLIRHLSKIISEELGNNTPINCFVIREKIKHLFNYFKHTHYVKSRNNWRDMLRCNICNVKRHHTFFLHNDLIFNLKNINPNNIVVNKTCSHCLRSKNILWNNINSLSNFCYENTLKYQKNIKISRCRFSSLINLHQNVFEDSNYIINSIKHIKETKSEQFLERIDWFDAYNYIMEKVNEIDNLYNERCTLKEAYGRWFDFVVDKYKIGIYEAVRNLPSAKEALGEPMMPITKTPKLTYIMKDEVNNLYKIGKSINPKHREKTLQSEKPSIKMIKIFDKDIEKELHSKYKKYRKRGEWFDLTHIQVQYICKHY
jgi:hypothetical protein